MAQRSAPAPPWEKRPDRPWRASPRDLTEFERATKVPGSNVIHYDTTASRRKGVSGAALASRPVSRQFAPDPR